MITKCGQLIIVILGVMVCGIDADFPCKPEQIHWVGTPGKRYKCLECPDCPAGSQPSVSCGSSVSYGTAVHCVPCKLSKTYSNSYDKAECKACTVCSPGKAVVKNCTLSSNTECDDKCEHGYYPVPFIFDCLQCTECCNDGKDEIAKDCTTYGQKCKVRSTPCVRVQTAPSKTKTLSTALPTTLVVTKELVKQTSPVTPTLSGNNRQRDAESKAVKSDGDSGENKTLIIVSTVSALLALFISILALIIYIARGKFKCHWNKNSNNDNGIELASQPNPPTSASQEQLNQDDTTLEWLESKHLDLFDWMCLKLDNGRRWTGRRDYERLAAKYNKISLEERHSLRDQLQIEGGSPSKALMSLLQTKYPSLPLRHFAGTLSAIGRNDIAQRLMPYVKQNVNSPPA